MLKKIALFSAFAIALMAGSCEPVNNADTREAKATAQLTADASAQVGVPSITNFTEKKLVKMMYELRDRPNYRTYAYIVTLDGRFVKFCDSIGYGISASTQFTNPERVVNLDDFLGVTGYTAGTIPQPEPNALFMPTGLAATYVMCVSPVDKTVVPVYMEQDVAISPFPLVAE